MENIKAMTDKIVDSYPRLVIEHNHGHLTLTNVDIIEREETSIDYIGGGGRRQRVVRIARGITESGGYMSRLFHATSYTPFPVGKVKEWPLYGRTPYQSGAGEWRVSCVFCG